MDKLPAELLHKIFIELKLEQRLKCLTVCRSWWRVLDRYSLFYDLLLEEGDDNGLNTFMDTLKHLPNRAAQVEKIQLESEITLVLTEENFLIFFPTRVYLK
jgi:hypothetical protein